MKTYSVPRLKFVNVVEHSVITTSVQSVENNVEFNPVISGSVGPARAGELRFEDWDAGY